MLASTSICYLGSSSIQWPIWMKVILFLSLGMFPGHYQHMLKFPMSNVIPNPLLPDARLTASIWLASHLCKKSHGTCQPDPKWHFSSGCWDSVLVLLSDHYKKKKKNPTKGLDTYVPPTLLTVPALYSSTGTLLSKLLSRIHMHTFSRILKILFPTCSS